MKNKKCLFVDLDGTLIKSDLLYECLLYVLKHSFFSIFLAPFWLLKGKAYLKEKFASLISLDAKTLPYNKEALYYIKNQKENNNLHVVLATASNYKLANLISSTLNIFDAVLASDEKQNLKGKNKLLKIKKYLDENNFDKDFSYMGDSNADIPILNEASVPVVVGNKDIYEKIRGKNSNAYFISESSHLTLKNFLKMIRTYQWVKNFLIFVPLILAHKFLDVDLIFKAVIAFFSFSFLASSVYIINDLMDLESDRLHPIKKDRPLASGKISISTGLKVSLFLMPFAFVISIFLGKEFLLALLLYFVTTTLYSFFLKKVALVDIIVLALLYTIRIFAGGMALYIYLSPWLFMFSLFIFFSLACAKRYSELYAVRNNLQKEIKGRGYESLDLEQIQIFGSSSGYIAVLIFALYIQSEIPKELYRSPSYLWGLCPLMLYWISRVWLISHRGKMTHDPIIFALKDRASYVILSLVIIIFGVAKYV